jgi:hypothetical protein
MRPVVPMKASKPSGPGINVSQFGCSALWHEATGLAFAFQFIGTWGF